MILRLATAVSRVAVAVTVRGVRQASHSAFKLPRTKFRHRSLLNTPTQDEGGSVIVIKAPVTQGDSDVQEPGSNSKQRGRGDRRQKSQSDITLQERQEEESELILGGFNARQGSAKASNQHKMRWQKKSLSSLYQYESSEDSTKLHEKSGKPWKMKSNHSRYPTKTAGPKVNTKSQSQTLKYTLADTRTEIKGEIIYGIFPVLLALQAGRRTIHRLIYKGSSSGDVNSRIQDILKVAEGQGVPITRLNLNKFRHIFQGDEVHQGVCCDVSPLSFVSLDDENPEWRKKHKGGGEDEGRVGGGEEWEQEWENKERRKIKRHKEQELGERRRDKVEKIEKWEQAWGDKEENGEIGRSKEYHRVSGHGGEKVREKSEELKQECDNSMDKRNLEGKKKNNEEECESTIHKVEETEHQGREIEHASQVEKRNEEEDEKYSIHEEARERRYEKNKQRQQEEVEEQEQGSHQAGRGRKHLLWLYLDQIQDPMNFGAVLRSAYFMGVDRVITSETFSSRINSTVSKASSGVAEVFPVHQARDPVSLATTLMRSGWEIVSSASPSDGGDGSVQLTSVTAFRPQGNVLLIVGNEGKGITPELQQLCGTVLTITPGRSLHPNIQCLNVSVATALLLHSLHTAMSAPDP